jgi:hypothetical protein
VVTPTRTLVRLQRLTATRAGVFTILIDHPTTVLRAGVLGVVALWALPLLHVAFVDFTTATIARKRRLGTAGVFIVAAVGSTEQSTKKTHIAP